MAEAPNTSTEAASGEAPKSKKNLFLIVGVLVAVLAAGGGAAAYFVGGDSEEEPVADDGKETKGGKKAKKKDNKPKLPAQYVKLDPPFVVNFEAKGLMRFLQVAIEIMTRDPVTADLIAKNDPMIRNDLIMLLGSQTYETISSREGKEQLRVEALAVVAKIIAAEGGKAENVEQLYFTSFVMQ